MTRLINKIKKEKEEEFASDFIELMQAGLATTEDYITHIANSTGDLKRWVFENIGFVKSNYDDVNKDTGYTFSFKGRRYVIPSIDEQASWELLKVKLEKFDVLIVMFVFPGSSLHFSYFVKKQMQIQDLLGALEKNGLIIKDGHTILWKGQESKIFESASEKTIVKTFSKFISESQKSLSEKELTDLLDAGFIPLETYLELLVQSGADLAEFFTENVGYFSYVMAQTKSVHDRYVKYVVTYRDTKYDLPKYATTSQYLIHSIKERVERAAKALNVKFIIYTDDASLSVRSCTLYHVASDQIYRGIDEFIYEHVIGEDPPESRFVWPDFLYEKIKNLKNSRDQVVLPRSAGPVAS